jgi:hypothetical protein
VCDATMMKHLLYKLNELKMPKEKSYRTDHILVTWDCIALAIVTSIPLNLPGAK